MDCAVDLHVSRKQAVSNERSGARVERASKDGQRSLARAPDQASRTVAETAFGPMISRGDVSRHTIRPRPPMGPETEYAADYEARAGLPSGRAHRPLPGSGQMQPGTSGPQPDRASRSWQNSRAKRTYSNTMQVNCVRVRRRCGKPVYGKWPCKGTADAPPLHKCREYDLTCRAYVIIYARTR
mgnify:CR=1 FL=1